MSPTFSAACGIAGGIFALIIVIGLLVTKSKKPKKHPSDKNIPPEDVEIFLPQCFSVSPNGYLLINGKNLVSTRNRCYMDEIEHLFVSEAGNVFVKRIDDNDITLLVEFDNRGEIVTTHDTDNNGLKIFPVSYYRTRDDCMIVTVAM